jgi:hypothetical protein
MILYPEDDIRREASFDRLGVIWRDGVTPLEEAIAKAGVDRGHRKQAEHWWATWTFTALQSLRYGDRWAKPVSDLRRAELDRLRPPCRVLPFKRPDPAGDSGRPEGAA